MPDSAVLVEVASHRINRLLQSFSLQIRKTLRARHDADVIHDFRVSIRRFSQALDIFKSWLPASQLQPIRRQLKTFASAAGDVRDSDIGLELLAKSGARNVSRWSSRLHNQRKAAERRLVTPLRRWILQKRGAKWRADLAAIEIPQDLAAQSWPEFARGELPPVAKRFFQSGLHAERSHSGKELHKVRIATKKLRYALELFQDALGPDGAVRVDQLRKLQTVLGNINDVRTARKLFNELGAGRKLTAPLRKKQRKLTREFHSLWQTEFSRAEAKEWIQFLRTVPRKPAARSTAASGDPALAASSTKSA